MADELVLPLSCLPFLCSPRARQGLPRWNTRWGTGMKLAPSPQPSSPPSPGSSFFCGFWGSAEPPYRRPLPFGGGLLACQWHSQRHFQQSPLPCLQGPGPPVLVERDAPWAVPARPSRNPRVLRLLDHGPDQRECCWGQAGRGRVGSHVAQSLPAQVKLLLFLRPGLGLSVTSRRQEDGRADPAGFI